VTGSAAAAINGRCAVNFVHAPYYSLRQEKSEIEETASRVPIGASSVLGQLNNPCFQFSLSTFSEFFTRACGVLLLVLSCGASDYELHVASVRGLWS